MTLNLTLLVQMLNFVLAWVVMERLFWRPALKALYEYDAQQDALSKKLMNARRVFEQAEHELKKQQLESLDAYKHRLPSCSFHLHAAHQLTLSHHNANDEFAHLVESAARSSKPSVDFDHLSQELSNRIVKRVSDGK